MAASGAPAPGNAGAMAEFWRGRRVLLTGHTGFKGAWMSLWLGQMGAEVTGVVAGTVDQGGFSAAHKLGPHKIHPRR